MRITPPHTSEKLYIGLMLRPPIGATEALREATRRPKSPTTGGS